MPQAARISDMHRCPDHTGGAVSSGEETVIIGFQAAARVSDEAKCKGPSDAISEGEPSVIIGYEDAARMGDPTEHGGVIVAGCPTVIIGSSPQIDVLVAAAEEGAPFCEECERKRLEKERRRRLEE